MTRDQHTTEQAPGTGPDGPESAQNPQDGTEQRPGVPNEAQAGAQGFEVQPGQIYRSCDRRGGPRIRIHSYTPGAARAQVVDAYDGKRQRQILVSSLHPNDITKTGARRRTGYALEAK